VTSAQLSRKTHDSAPFGGRMPGERVVRVSTRHWVGRVDTMTATGMLE
jgi:hypothetical protein